MELIPIGHGEIILCSGTLDETTKDTLLACIDDSLSHDRHYVLLDLGSLNCSDDSILHVLPVAQQSASRKGKKLEMVAGETVDQILRGHEGCDG